MYIRARSNTAVSRNVLTHDNSYEVESKSHWDSDGKPVTQQLIYIPSGHVSILFIVYFLSFHQCILDFCKLGYIYLPTSIRRFARKRIISSTPHKTGWDSWPKNFNGLFNSMDAHQQFVKAHCESSYRTSGLLTLEGKESSIFWCSKPSEVLQKWEIKQKYHTETYDEKDIYPFPKLNLQSLSFPLLRAYVYRWKSTWIIHEKFKKIVLTCYSTTSQNLYLPSNVW